MMNLLKPLFIVVAVSVAFIFSCSAPRLSSNASPVSHAAWDALLQKHVDEQGLVDYKGFLRDSIQFRAYLKDLSTHAPNRKTWSDAEQMAYWINAYNAFTVDLIIRHYPVASIKDIQNGIPFVNTVWDIKFFKIMGEDFDLNNIEHGILRKQFDDPRIHFALVCASLSCPKLQNRAFDAATLDEQLDNAAQAFFREPFRNAIYNDPPAYSKILDWYWMDFKDKYPSRQALVQQYVPETLSSDGETFLEYDWRLNAQTPENTKLLKGE